MSGNDVGHIDLPIVRFAPHAATGGALIGVPLIFIVISDVIHDDGLVLCVHCRR